MEIENLNVNGMIVLHVVVPITGDGACLFQALSYVLYGNQQLAMEVREQIVDHVVQNWGEFSIMSHDNNGNNYINAAAYFEDMSRLCTYGGLCELIAAGQLFEYVFEVYRNGQLYAKFGREGNPVERLRFTQNLSSGNFDAYLPSESDSTIITTLSRTHSNVATPRSQASIRPVSISKPIRKRRARCTDVRRKQLNDARKKYVQENREARCAAVAVYQEKKPDVHRAAAARYQHNKPDVHRAAVSRYQHNKPEVHRATVAKYEKNNPNKRVERRSVPWKVKAYSGMAYDLEVAYDNDSTVALGTMSHKCKYCNALMWKDEAPGMCCSAGKVQLPPFEPLPEPLYSLLMDMHPEHAHFMNHIRKYNGCFKMTSFGAKQVIEGGFMPTFKVQGQVYHLFGSLLPVPQQERQFLQIYFVGEDEGKHA